MQVPRALTVGSKLPERAAFSAHVRQQAGQRVDTHGQTGLRTPALAVAALASSRALAQYRYRPATSKLLQMIRSSKMGASDGAWTREPNSVGRDAALQLPQQHMTRFNTLGDDRPQAQRPAPRPPPQAQPKRAAAQLASRSGGGAYGSLSERNEMASWPNSRATTASVTYRDMPIDLSSRGSLEMRGSPRKLGKLQ
jgi:hypothetical protein